MSSCADHLSDLMIGVDQGDIALPADFPTLISVSVGDRYTVTAPVTDNDPLKTNTGLTFATNDVIFWNGETWHVVTFNITDIFVDTMPEEPNNNMTLRDVPGDPYTFFHNEQINPLEFMAVKLLVRNFSYVDAVKEIQSAMLYLTKITPHTVPASGGIPEYRYFRITAKTGFYSLGKDDKKRNTLMIDFRVSRKTVT